MRVKWCKMHIMQYVLNMRQIEKDQATRVAKDLFGKFEIAGNIDTHTFIFNFVWKV